MAHDIIMPALGMAQDTGLLVAWRKAPGDAVRVGEALFEVETDKATMEVEAGFAGFLSSVTAAEGTDVPVGQVIARIVETEAEVDRAPVKGKAAPAPSAPVAAAPASPPTTTPVAVPPHDAAAVKPAPAPAKPAPAPRATAAPAASAPKAPLSAQGRILASPKARTQARAEGLDLSRLVRAGHPQPYHVADLDRLRGQAAARSVLTARVDGTALLALLKKAKDADAGRVIAAFARAAWTQVSGEDLTVALMRADGTEEGGGTLLLVDLTSTRLTAYAPPDGLTLSVGQEGASLTLTLSFDDLPFTQAAAFLDETAARVEDPLRQLI